MKTILKLKMKIIHTKINKTYNSMKNYIYIYKETIYILYEDVIQRIYRSHNIFKLYCFTQQQQQAEQKIRIYREKTKQKLFIGRTFKESIFVVCVKGDGVYQKVNKSYACTG